MIVGFTSFYSMGCTFLDWSFNWLCGHDHFWSIKKGKWLPLVRDPLTLINAHNHYCNRFEQPDHDWVGPLIACKESIGKENLSFYGEGNPRFLGRTANSINNAISMGVKIVFMFSPVERTGVGNRTSTLENHRDKNIRNLALKNKILLEFKTVKDISLRVKNFGEMRKFLTFSSKYLVRPPCKKLITEVDVHSTNFIPFEQNSFVKHGEDSIRTLFDKLNVSLDVGRISHWRNIYEIWKKNYLGEILLAENMSRVVDAIRKGESHSLEQYDLDIWKESWIQFRLLRDHGQYLNTINLDEFPNNTKELTGLLTG